MKNAKLINPELMNEFEMIQVGHYMDTHKPDTLYTMSPGNKCIWVYFHAQDWYFIFRDGKIVDIQID
jgi:hypothetical protein